MTDKTLGAYERRNAGPLEQAADRLIAFMRGDDMDGGVTAAAIEKEVDRADALAQLEALGDDGTALRCAVMIASVGAGEKTVAEFCKQVARGDDVNVAARAEKAERERDWAEDTLEQRAKDFRVVQAQRDYSRERARKAEKERDHWKREADGANADLADLRTAEPRSLTPDAITDEMVDRARQRGSEIVGVLWDASVVEAMLTAALTEPPARPEGAEELGELIGTWTASEDIAPAQLPTGSLATLADFLAERGVRVVGEGQP